MRRIAFFLACFYCLAACDNMIIDIPDNTPDDPTSSPIELFMPNAEMVSVYSTATVSENTIDELWALVFNGTAPYTKKWCEKINGSQIVRNGDASQLLPQLKHKPEPGDSIICIANVDPVSNADTNAVTLATINDYFRLTDNGYYTGTEHLPMSGGFKWAETSSNICVMTRAVAKIQVQMGTSVSDITGNFTAENVYYQVHLGAAGGYIMPTSPISGKENTIGMRTPEQYRLLQKEGASQDELSVFLYEYRSGSRTGLDANNAISETTFHPDRQYIILHKVTGTNTRYYRLDFFDPDDSVYIDTKRNHHYLFTINNVRSEGYETLPEAQKNPGSNLEYTIKINDGAKDIISNGQYAIVLTMDSEFGPGANLAFNVGSVRYEIPPGMSSTLYDFSVNSVTLSNVSPAGAFSLTSSASMTSGNLPITLTTGSGTSSATGTLTFRLGNITYVKNIALRAVY